LRPSACLKQALSCRRYPVEAAGLASRPLLFHMTPMKPRFAIPRLRSRQRTLLHMYRTVADFTYDLEIWMEPTGSLRYVSPSCLRMTGYAAEDARRDKDFFARIIMPEDYPEWQRTMDCGHREDIAAMDFRIRHLDGSQIWLSQETTRVFDPRGRFHGWRLSLRDVTERVQTRMWLDQARQNLEERVRERTAELELSRERYRALSGYLQDRIEKERAHISREIHDVLGQDMTAMNMGLHRLERSFQEAGDSRLAQVVELRTLVAGTLETVRRISRELRPPMLDELGFVEAVAWQIRTFAQASGLRVDQQIMGIPDLPADLATSMYRVLQECLTNAARHSGCSRLHVAVHAAEGELVMRVADNGRGITPSQAESSGSLGLLGMRERVRLAGGKLKVNRLPKGGTEIAVRVPLTGENGSCVS
jgi:two-component system, NarL family, sensor histidine kinase UhpB